LQAPSQTRWPPLEIPRPRSLSLIRRLPLEIPRPRSLNHDPTAAAHVKSLTGGRIMAMARKNSILSDSRHSCNLTQRKKGDGHSSQAPSHTRWPPLEIPRPRSLSLIRQPPLEIPYPRSLNHDPTAAAHVKSLTGGRIMAVARKNSILSDSRRSCNFTQRKKGDGRSLQAPSHTRWRPLEIPRPRSLSLIRQPPLEIPRPRSLNHDPTAAAHVNSLTGGWMVAVTRKHPVIPDGRLAKSHA